MNNWSLIILISSCNPALKSYDERIYASVQIFFTGLNWLPELRIG